MFEGVGHFIGSLQETQVSTECLEIGRRIKRAILGPKIEPALEKGGPVEER